MMLVWMLIGCGPAEIQFLPDLWNQEGWDTAAWDMPTADTGANVMTRDTGDEDEGVRIDDDTLAWGCNGASTAYALGLRTRGAAGGGELRLFASSGWTETHPLLLVDLSPSGLWDEYAAGPLLDATPQEEVVAGSSTAFVCGGTEPAAVLLVRDRLGTAVDCVRMGPTDAGAEAWMSGGELAELSCRWLSPM